MWKDIENWEDYYEVSDSGEVRNKETGKMIVGDVNSAGYYRVCLYRKGHNPPKQRFFRHRLVAQHFLPNPKGLPEVNHKDANREHNYKENLEWADKIENERHSRRLGKKPYKPFEVSYTDGTVKEYESREDFAKDVGVTRAAVKYWLRGINSGYLERNIKSVRYL